MAGFPDHLDTEDLKREGDLFFLLAKTICTYLENLSSLLFNDDCMRTKVRCRACSLSKIKEKQHWIRKKRLQCMCTACFLKAL